MKRLLLTACLLCACGVESPDTKPPEPEITVPLSGGGGAVFVNRTTSAPVSTQPAEVKETEDTPNPINAPDSLIREYIDNKCLPNFKSVLESRHDEENIEVWADYPYVLTKGPYDSGSTILWEYEINLKDSVGFAHTPFDDEGVTKHRPTKCTVRVFFHRRINEFRASGSVGLYLDGVPI